MFLGYNTNGLAHHDPFQAVELLARLGYRGVALTLDHGPLSPLEAGFLGHVAQMRDLLQSLEMRSVVETGARYLLDAWAKHEPTLVSADRAGRARRVEFLKAAIDSAAILGSDCVSLWSGVVHDGASEDEALHRLLGGLHEVVGYAAARNVIVGFEPEPGMLVETLDQFDRLSEAIQHPALQLTLDVGHLHCLDETPIASQIRSYASRIVNIHIEDMRRGVHEHLMFGEGEMDFPPILAALEEFGYDRGVYVELSRHSHVGPQAARRALEFLRPLVAQT